MKTKLPLVRRIGLFLGRFRRLPATFWAILAAFFGVADFLTWSLLAQVAPQDRIWWTIGIAITCLLVTVIAVLRRPTEDEKMIQARVLGRTAREAYDATNYVRAATLLRRTVGLDPERVSAWGLLGRTLVRLGEYKEAISALRPAIELTQVNRALYLHNRGVAYAMLGQYGRALDDFDQSLREKPNRHKTLRWRGLIWLYLGRLDNALQDVDSALTIRPHYLCGHATKSAVLNRLGQSEAAENELAQCDRLRPNDADDFYCLALAYSQLRGVHEALGALRIAIERDPKYRARAAIEPLFDQLRTAPGFLDLLSDDSSPAVRTKGDGALTDI